MTKKLKVSKMSADEPNYDEILEIGGTSPRGDVRSNEAIEADFEGSMTPAEVWVRWKAAEQNLAETRSDLNRANGRVDNADVDRAHWGDKYRDANAWVAKLSFLLVISVLAAAILGLVTYKSVSDHLEALTQLSDADSRARAQDHKLTEYINRERTCISKVEECGDHLKDSLEQEAQWKMRCGPKGDE